jgi:hypothetical protein
MIIRCLLSSEQVYREPVLTTLGLFVPLASLMHDDVYDFILLADIPCRYRH